MIHNDHINIEIDDKAIERVDETKSLGLPIDKHLAWARHVENISKKTSSAIEALKRVCCLYITDIVMKNYLALTQPYFDYYSLVWNGLSINYVNDKLQKCQNRAARFIIKSRYNTSPSELIGKLGWDNLLIRRKKHKAIFMFKTNK